jgi:DegV family protein with EDD domain
MAIRIVTDSTAYLREDILSQYDIQVVPLKVLFADRVYKDGVDLTNEEFYDMLSRVEKLPTTSQPATGEFERVYSELVGQGHEIISIHISGKLSGTVESARAAARHFPEAKVHVVDSLSTVFGLALMILEAAKAARQQYDSGYILHQLDQMIRNTTVLFVVDTLEYLEKGGRIGAARALLGTLLKIKPILKIEDGLIVPVTSVRTKSKAIAFMLDQAVELVDHKQARVAVAHAQVPSEMEALLKMVRERLVIPEGVFISEVGPVVGTHTGPGVLGIAVCPLES